MAINTASVSLAAASHAGKREVPQRGAFMVCMVPVPANVSVENLRSEHKMVRRVHDCFVPKVPSEGLHESLAAARMEVPDSGAYVVLMSGLPHVGPRNYQKLISMLTNLLKCQHVFMPHDKTTGLTFSFAFIACFDKAGYESVMSLNHKRLANFNVQTMGTGEVKMLMRSKDARLSVFNMNVFQSRHEICAYLLFVSASHDDYEYCRDLLSQRFSDISSAIWLNKALHCFASKTNSNAESVGISLFNHPDFAGTESLDVRGRTVLHNALESYHFSLCRVVLTSGKFQNVNAVTELSETAFAIAFAKLQMSIRQSLPEAHDLREVLALIEQHSQFDLNTRAVCELDVCSDARADLLIEGTSQALLELKEVLQVSENQVTLPGPLNGPNDRPGSAVGGDGTHLDVSKLQALRTAGKQGRQHAAHQRRNKLRCEKRRLRSTHFEGL